VKRDAEVMAKAILDIELILSEYFGSPLGTATTPSA
jgi:hypothetical protein